MAKKSKKNKKLKSWSHFKQVQFKKQPNDAYEYLQASLDENADVPEAIIEAIRTVSESLHMTLEDVAKKAKIQPSTVYKAFGKDGNPTLETLTAVLKAIGLKLSIEKAS
jgi:probable addiction module antidote protein